MEFERIEQLIYFLKTFDTTNNVVLRISSPLYGKVIQYILNYNLSFNHEKLGDGTTITTIVVGPNKGLMFRNVELLINE